MAGRKLREGKLVAFLWDAKNAGCARANGKQGWEKSISEVENGPPT